MPQAFDDCVKSGGKVRTKSLPDGRYVLTCYKDGESYSGEVKQKKSTLRQAHATPKPAPTKLG